jgi:hypothetical protein
MITNKGLNYRRPEIFKNSMGKNTEKPNIELQHQICKELVHLQNFGFKIFSFNKRDLLSFGLKYFVHHIIVSKNYLVFVEVKQVKDLVSPEQKELQITLSHLTSMNRSLHYRVIRNIQECRNLIRLLIAKKL